jgi:hypothetical protein
MMLPRTGEGLPPWRRQVSAWLMGALRLGVAWLVARDPYSALAGAKGAFLSESMPTALRWAAAAGIVAGGLLFAWPRTVLVGFGVLAASLAVFEWYWRKIGVGGSTFAYSLAVLAVLAAGEWLVRRVQRRLYSPPGA